MARNNNDRYIYRCETKAVSKPTSKLYTLNHFQLRRIHPALTISLQVQWKMSALILQSHSVIVFNLHEAIYIRFQDQNCKGTACVKKKAMIVILFLTSDEKAFILFYKSYISNPFFFFFNFFTEQISLFNGHFGILTGKYTSKALLFYTKTLSSAFEKVTTTMTFSISSRKLLTPWIMVFYSLSSIDS